MSLDGTAGSIARQRHDRLWIDKWGVFPQLVDPDVDLIHERFFKLDKDNEDSLWTTLSNSTNLLYSCISKRRLFPSCFPLFLLSRFSIGPVSHNPVRLERSGVC
jgi:hypothetical protein